jgi:hypothetical protein
MLGTVGLGESGWVASRGSLERACSPVAHLSVTVRTQLLQEKRRRPYIREDGHNDERMRPLSTAKQRVSGAHRFVGITLSP